jgi:hypothetical protein
MNLFYFVEKLVTIYFLVYCFYTEFLGCGKTTLVQYLAQKTGIYFLKKSLINGTTDSLDRS